MKVDGITLLQMIRDGKIKDGNKISCSDFVSSYYFKSGTLGYYNKDENGIIKFVELSLKDIIENIKYATYEIIEEIEKTKKIELIDNSIIDIDELGKHTITTNKKDRNIYIPRINWLIDKVDYLLKKEDDKE